MKKKELNSKLQQKSHILRESHIFEIYNNKFIKVIKNNLFNNQSYHLNLTMLAPWPVQHKVIAWNWILVSLFFSLITFAYFFSPRNEQPAILLLLITLSFIVFFISIFRSKNIIEFKSRYGNCVVLSLSYNKPAEKKFIEEIKFRSFTASQEMKMDIKEMLDIEIGELKRLKNEGVIQTIHYKEAKARIKKVQIQS